MEKRLQDYITKLEAELIEYNEIIASYELVLDGGGQINLVDEENYITFIGKSEVLKKVIDELKSL